eukprot:5961097-Prymnesium_polylepis.1
MRCGTRAHRSSGPIRDTAESETSYGSMHESIHAPRGGHDRAPSASPCAAQPPHWSHRLAATWRPRCDTAIRTKSSHMRPPNAHEHSSRAPVERRGEKQSGRARERWRCAAARPSRSPVPSRVRAVGCRPQQLVGSSLGGHPSELIGEGRDRGGHVVLEQPREEGEEHGGKPDADDDVHDQVVLVRRRLPEAIKPNSRRAESATPRAIVRMQTTRSWGSIAAG